MNKNGFSLIEVLLYVAILAIVSGLFAGILSVSTKVQLRESANNEVGTQLNFMLQTIQRLIRESSNIEFANADDPTTTGTNEGDNPETSAVEFAYLKLRMTKSTDDPTCISLLENTPGPAGQGSIFLVKGPAASPQNCNNPTPADKLTTDKVYVPIPIPPDPPGITFTKFTNYPGHDSVQVDLTLAYNTDNPQSVFTKSLTTAIGRVSAATFDSNLLPGAASTYDIGQDLTRWKDLFIQNLNVGGTISQGGNYNGSGGRGFFVLAAFPGLSCNSACTAHGLICNTFNTSQILFSGAASNCTDTGTTRFCFCE